MPIGLVSPPKMTFGITEACPLKCRFCYADCAQKPKAGELDVDEWIRLVDQVCHDGVIQFYIEGGEPLIKPGIFRLIEHCARMAMTMLRTHATLIDATVADAL